MSSVTDYKQLATGAASGAASGAIAGSVVPGIGTAVGAGIGLLGGALSNLSHERQADKGYAYQEEALKNGISWRVADAKRAGIHPLYALGAPSMSMQPIITQDQIGPAVQQMGQSMSDITRNTLNEQQKANQAMEYLVMSSQRNKNDAEAELARTQAASLVQKQRTNINPPGLGIQNEMGQNPTGGGLGFYDVKAAEQISAKPGHEYSSAGINPALQLRMIDRNLPMYMDIAEGDSPEETWKEKGYLPSLGLALRNARIFGDGWMWDFIKSRYLGLNVTGKYDVNAKDDGSKADWEDELRMAVGKGIKQKMIDYTGKNLMPYGSNLPQIRIEKRHK